MLSSLQVIDGMATVGKIEEVRAYKDAAILCTTRLLLCARVKYCHCLSTHIRAASCSLFCIQTLKNINKTHTGSCSGRGRASPAESHYRGVRPAYLISRSAASLFDIEECGQLI